MRTSGDLTGLSDTDGWLNTCLILWEKPENSPLVDVVVQSSTPKHGIEREHPETAAGHGRMMPTSKVPKKLGHHPLTA